MTTPAAIGYVRVSTTEQATDGISIDMQTKAVRAYAQMRGLDLAEVIADEGISAGKPLSARPGGAAVLAAVRRQDAGAVVAYKLDRLFRDCADCLTVTRTWDGLGAALHLVDLGGQAVDTSSAMGRFFLTVMAGAAELERNQISERTSAAMRHKASRGEYTGGGVPYGYQLADDGVHLEELPSEQRVIRLGRRLRERGLSYVKIAAELERQGVPARTGRWHPQKVSNMLTGLHSNL